MNIDYISSATHMEIRQRDMFVQYLAISLPQILVAWTHNPYSDEVLLLV